MSQIARQLIFDNLIHLEQGRNLLKQVTDEQYKTVPCGLHPHRVGGHVRHCLEFYDCLIEGLAEGTVDYSSRRRNLDLEECRHTALRHFDQTADRLQALALSLSDSPALAKGIRRGSSSVVMPTGRLAAPAPAVDCEGDSPSPRAVHPNRYPVTLRVCTEGACGGERGWVFSNLARELQFLASHTVHHYALIALTLTALGVPVDADFGMAPSTLRHAERQQCAR